MNSTATSQLIEKMMALSEREFINSVSALLPPETAATGLQVSIPLAMGRVTIAYQALPPARLSRSLELPRARVVLTFENISDAEREAFLARFDIAFQRGGG